MRRTPPQLIPAPRASSLLNAKRRERELDAMDRKLLGVLVEDATTSYAELGERVGLSPSGGGVAVWLGDQIRLTLDWDQALQLRRLLVDQFDRGESAR